MTLLLCIAIWYLMYNEWLTLEQSRVAFKVGESIAQLMPIEAIFWACMFFLWRCS